jgi:hypothetical protein|mmetsp:Transcript_17753/g.28898  ORF Transcript_17753/g.28898 Transcript_17753/m.28898 type:complete len:222 (+) Transcript_17753:77-742(+)|eukprot:CAMPEP_0169130966 /NCGR_PEP_ID=MMETSP1015-20121227/37995_1 /TAXON_ID=342587 /ORGANISM="Karlodinium micrum, Strain CCMP2283" /LENGTH=221 /DNA_ID=CAMNT_0009195195 /DNA_START=76 /DNA_END=741 /DNA_ORIENTATION=-
MVAQKLAEQFPEEGQKIPLPVIVKNTFLDMDDDDFEVDPRRCTSEPPQCRKREKPRIPVLLGMSEVTSDFSGSTTSGSPRDCSESDTASEGRSRLSSLSSGLNPNAPAWSPTQPMSNLQSSTILGPRLQGPPLFQMPIGPPTQAFDEPALVVPPPPQYPQHRFNANAMPWDPTSVFASSEASGNGITNANHEVSPMVPGFCYNQQATIASEWQQTLQSWTH